MSRPSTIHGLRQIGTTAVAGRTRGGSAQIACASRSQAGSGAAEDGAEPVERVQSLVDRRRGGHPHRDARGPQRGDVLVAVLLGVGHHEVGAQGETRATSGHLVPPTRATSSPAGCVHQSVAPARSPASVAAMASVSDGTRLTTRRGGRPTYGSPPVVPHLPACRQTSVTRTPAWTLYRRLTDTRLMVSASTWRALRSRPA